MATTTLTREGTIYTSTARFDSDQRALTEKELKLLAPSIFAREAHESRSERFAPIPTIEVLRHIAKAGFVPVGVKESTARDSGKAPFTKHLIRLRRLDGEQRQVGDTVFEMLMKNANDGSAAYHLLAGLWRIRCMNSLVTQDRKLGEVAIRHTGDAPKEVLEASFKVLERADTTLQTAARWGKIELKEIERLNFAKKAHKRAFVDKHLKGLSPDDRAKADVTRATYGVASAVKPAMLLEARRDGDKGTDLWTTFNVIQENVIKGGQSGYGHDSVGRACNYTSRPVKSIDADVTMNTFLWGLADELATKKGALV
jgi:hypothetical protein